MSENQSLLDRYQSAMQAYLLSQCPWLVSVSLDAAMLAAEPLATPCALLNIERWEPAAENSHQAMPRFDLSCQLIVMVAADGSDGSTGILNAAMALSRALSDQAPGPDLLPATLVSAQPYVLEATWDGYHAWELQLQQPLEFTEGLEEGTTPHALWIGLSPDIGTEHLSDYQLIIDTEAS
ncbi:hypothetical protein [Celerinatantimonas sp. YJH-8]|uniref:hypothetical protein n=1 Tax=Celerinatantimonas sp. YJH-8 TaxID=3228714 RepID=UPI0038C91360